MMVGTESNLKFCVFFCQRRSLCGFTVIDLSKYWTRAAIMYSGLTRRYQVNHGCIGPLNASCVVMVLKGLKFVRILNSRRPVMLCSFCLPMMTIQSPANLWDMRQAIIILYFVGEFGHSMCPAGYSNYFFGSTRHWTTTILLKSHFSLTP